MTIQEQTERAAAEYSQLYPMPMAEDAACGFMAGAEWERQRDKWISVKDQLPPKRKDCNQSDEVLVSDGKRISIGWHAYYPNESSRNYWYASPISGYDVKFWQPLPELPKRKED